MKLEELPVPQLTELVVSLRKEYRLLSGNRMALDLTRGKPAADQLDLSVALDDQINGDFVAEDGTDTRNYGGLRGIPEARALGAELLGVQPEQVIAGGNSSLALMSLVVETALRHGLTADQDPWDLTERPKLLAPVPGYDRHFALTESLNLEMVNVPMTPSGPDMAAANRLVSEDPSIKGVWCVPKFSNPTGCIYSDATVDAIAQLPRVAAASNFVVLWDNAYSVHDLTWPAEKLASLAEAGVRHGTDDHLVQFASTSKITFAGAGVAFVSSSESVLSQLEAQLGLSTIGNDKLNQLRHARFLRSRLEAHMQGHAKLLKPKFELVEQKLADGLSDLEIATWTQPKGGYFVNLDVQPGLATKIVEMADAVGLKLTKAGATFPYGKDPEDKNIRIAPTFADLDSLNAALDVLVLCVKLASAEARAGSL